jgi:putative hydroxymethylpyrimidine transport system ATP-binding protein
METVFFMSIPAPTIHLDGVSFRFQDKYLFESLDVTIPGGQWTCLLGPSGCGKSTLLRLISGSLKNGSSGNITFQDSAPGSGQTAWMAQQDLLLPWLTVLENVCLGSRLRGTATEEIYAEARELIDRAGLKGYADSLPSVLSGGMRQRAALLRTLMEKRPVILMDEPFSALDALTRLKLQDLAAQLVKGATVFLVTHDPLEALRLGHQIHIMTGHPARIGQAIVPPGAPPRNPSDPQLATLQGEMLRRLNGEDAR